MGTKKAGGGLQELLRTLRGHAIDILMRENPTKKAYYSLVWENQTLEELVNYKLPDVYEDVPEVGFAGTDDHPGDSFTVLGYLQQLFKELAEKLERAVPPEDRRELSIKQLVWASEPLGSDDGAQEQALQDGEEKSLLGLASDKSLPGRKPPAFRSVGQ